MIFIPDRRNFFHLLCFNFIKLVIHTLSPFIFLVFHLQNLGFFTQTNTFHTVLLHSFFTFVSSYSWLNFNFFFDSWSLSLFPYASHFCTSLSILFLTLISHIFLLFFETNKFLLFLSPQFWPKLNTIVIYLMVFCKYIFLSFLNFLFLFTLLLFLWFLTNLTILTLKSICVIICRILICVTLDMDRFPFADYLTLTSLLSKIIKDPLSPFPLYLLLVWLLFILFPLLILLPLLPFLPLLFLYVLTDNYLLL